MKKISFQKKSFAFALHITGLDKIVTNEKKEFGLSKQLLRRDTSIGANVEEPLAGRFRPGFINKTNISAKENREFSGWL